MASFTEFLDNTWAQDERESLCDLLIELGPDAPTLCGDWTTRQLAGHLVTREARPDAAAGIGFAPLSGWTAKVEKKYSKRDFNQLVDAIRSGPPLFSPFRIPGADRMANTAEYFVHFEDVRRAKDLWEPRELEPEFADYLWKLSKQRGSMLFRNSVVGVALNRTDRESETKLVKKVNPENQLGAVTISGPAQELVMYSFGRKAQSDVTIKGTAAAIEAFSSTDLSV